MHPAIEAKGLSHRYGRTEALHNLSLSIPQGSITALLGPNGAGKSTLLKLLVGLLKPHSGSATVLGLDSTTLKPADFARLGYSSDDQRVPTWMSLAHLMDYCRDMYPTWDNKLAASLVTLFSLPTGKTLERMSRGMRAKASLICSLAYRPELLLLDEPLSGIDILTREEIMQGVLELVTSDKGLTLLLSSHEIDDVERLCDWVVILMQGKLRACESLESLQGRTRFVEISGNLPPTRPALPADCWLEPGRQEKAIRFTAFDWNETSSQFSLEALYPDCEINVETLSLRQIYRAYALRFDNVES